MCPCAGFLVCSRRPSFLVRELRQANEILRKASAYLAQAELDIAFIGEDHRKAYGVEPIRKVLPSPHRPTMRISPSASHDVSKRSERNPELKIEVQPRKRDTIACNTSVSPIRTEDQPAPMIAILVRGAYFGRFELGGFKELGPRRKTCHRPGGYNTPAAA